MIPLNIPDNCIVEYRELTEEDREDMVGFYIHPKTGRYYYCLFLEDSSSQLIPTQTEVEYKEANKSN